MRVLIDGDGCPGKIKELLFRAAEKRGVEVLLVANRPVAVPRHARIRSVVVGQGLDVADDWLVQNVAAGELVITSDVPLAAQLVEKGATALSPRGELFTAENVGERLSLRDFFTEARASDVGVGGGPPPLDDKAVRRFANAFDTWLSRASRGA